MPKLRTGPLARQPHLNPDLDFWGWSTLDWCEENYIVLSFIAEFWNTMSNLVMIILGIYGVVLMLRLRLEPRFVLAFVGLVAIGAGSFTFHATLTYGGQLLDELPMIWATCVFLYCGRPVKLSAFTDTSLKMILLVYATIVTVLYTTVLKHEPVFHEVAYGILVVSLVIIGIRATITCPPPYKPMLRGLLVRAILSYGSGFALWNVDNFFCESIRETREGLPVVTRPLLQLHAWWHVAQWGTYVAIVFLVMRAHCEVGDISMRYACCGLLPILTKGQLAKE